MWGRFSVYLEKLKEDRKIRRKFLGGFLLVSVFVVAGVVWGFTQNGITLESGAETYCGYAEHTHTGDCYGWVPVESADADSDESSKDAGASSKSDGSSGNVSSAGSSETSDSEDAEVSSKSGSASGSPGTAETGSATGTDEDGDSEDAEASDGDSEDTEVSDDEADPSPGNTKTVNGQTYVYTLICDQEEHTHTDVCYVESVEEDAEDSDEDDSESYEMITSAGMFSTAVTALSDSSGEDSSGTTAYYFADCVTLADASQAQDEDYIIYTIIDGTYYIVSADDSLVPCTCLGTVTDTSADSFISSTADEGMYCWLDGDGNPVFKCTTDTGTDAFAYYRWEPDSADADSETGAGSYTLCNPETGNYLSPQEAGIGETLTGTAWWTGSQTGQDYSLASGCALVFTVTCKADVSSYAAFNVELYDSSNAHYLTTGSDAAAWFAGTDVQGSISGNSSVGSAITAEVTYTVSVVRSDESSSSTTYTVTYYNQTSGETFAEIIASDTDLNSDPVNVHIIAQVGTFEIGVTYATTKSANGTENSGIEDIYSSDHNNTTMDASGTTMLDAVQSQSVLLSGDFDITYTFYHTSSSSTNRNAAHNYVLALNNGNGKTVYIYANNTVTAVLDGASANVSCTTETLEYINNVASWRTYMEAGVTMTVHIVRQKNIFTITSTAVRNGTTTVSSYQAIISDDAFDGCDTTVYLTGLTCVLTDIQLSADSAVYDLQSCDTYNATGSVSDAVVLSAEGSSGWTASDTVDGSTVSLSSYGTDAAVWKTGSSSAVTLYFARVREYTAWFDGTNGGMATHNGSSDTGKVTSADAAGASFTVTAPTADETTDTKYVSLTLRGWYDIYNNVYYGPGDTVTLTGHTVLYADWVALSYDIGQDTDTVDSVNTSSFVTTKLFDFNELFNLYSTDLIDSAYVSGTVSGTSYGTTLYTSLSADGHSEVFSNGDGTIDNRLGTSNWNFLFFRSESYPYYYISSSYLNLTNPLLDYPVNRAVRNSNNSAGVTQGIVSDVDDDEGGLLDTLFDTKNTVDTASDTSSAVLGKVYVGEGEYLFQYDEDSGYYYYDSSLNGASYNQSAGRFYVYEDPATISGTTYFLPYNYGTLANTNYINYWFGMNTEITFYLTDDVGTGGNLDADGDPMVFKFSGDDDVWVFVDGNLVLDMGGVHGEVYGEIDFSTGKAYVVNDTSAITHDETTGVITYSDASKLVEQTETETVLSTLSPGSHTLQFYYLERGSGQSNAAIYYNIAPVYYLTLIAKDYETGDILAGTSFTVYSDEDCSTPMELPTDETGSTKQSTFTTDSNGELDIYGLRVGRTYYLKETEVQSPYPLNERILKLSVNSDGTVAVSVLDESDGSVLQTYSVDIGGNITAYTNDTTSTYPYMGEYDETGETSTDDRIQLKEIATSNYQITVTVYNRTEYELPATGGIGTDGFYRGGRFLVIVGLAALAALAYEKRRRKRVRGKFSPGDRKTPDTEDGRRMVRRDRSVGVPCVVSERGRPQCKSRGDPRGIARAFVKARRTACSRKSSRGRPMGCSPERPRGCPRERPGGYPRGYPEAGLRGVFRQVPDVEILNGFM